MLIYSFSLMRFSTKLVFTSPLINLGSVIIFIWIGIVVLTPSILYSLKALLMQAIESSLVF